MLDDLDRRIITRLCDDLGDSPEPFAELAAEMGIAEAALLARIEAYRTAGVLRRFGAILRHRQAGYTANGMSVWNVTDAAMPHLVELLTREDAVSHCYERPRFPGWPYNLYAMVHGMTREACLGIVTRIAAEAGVRDYQVLFSTREFKKTSMRYGTNRSSEHSSGPSGVFGKQ